MNIIILHLLVKVSNDLQINFKLWIINATFNQHATQLGNVKMRLLLILLILPAVVFSQSKGFEDNLEKVFVNAKKGIYYALSNIPDRKNSMSKELIDSDKLIAKVKLSKEVHGIKVESEGFYETYRVTIEVYRSYDKLVEEGYLKFIPED